MNSTTTTTRRPCFVGQDNGLASLADMEAGFSGYNNNNNNNNNSTNNGFYSRAVCSMRRSSLRNLASVSSPRSARFYDARFEEHQPHFLESCFLCKKPLGDNRDIFMYRGDTPFCSEDCRQEQIDMDENQEKNWNLSSMKALRKKDQRKSLSPTKNQDYPLRTGTVAAA